jgi:hypothetical protein
MTSNVRAFQIFYSEATRAALDPDFEPLDNSANERPDWYEYWPMRRFFATAELEESTYYGFFSPRFFGKTRLNGRQVLAFAGEAGEADLVSFSPHPCHSACFFNVFEQGENFFPGFRAVATEILRELNPEFRLDQLCNDSRNTVFCNYFVARPRFWREWNGVFARVFGLAEQRGSRLFDLLNRPIRYAKDDSGEEKPAQMKIMFMERVPSLLLSSRAFRVRNYAPFSMPLSAHFIGRLPELVALDALKVACVETGDAQFLQQFTARRDALLAAAFPKGQAKG